MRETDSFSGSLLDRAIIFAVKKHSGTLRKGTKIPYIVHPMEVAAIAAGITDDAEVIAAAVLHDTLEDTDTTFDELAENFGERVASLVAAESENKREEEKPEDTWKIRKEETIRHLSAAEYDVKVIALSDKLANIRAIQRDHEMLKDKFWDRFNQKDPSLHGWYYRSVGDALSGSDSLRETSAFREYVERVEAVFGVCKGMS